MSFAAETTSLPSNFDHSSFYAATKANGSGSVNAQQWHSLGWADVLPSAVSPSTAGISNSSAVIAEYLAAKPGAYFKLQQLAQSMGLNIYNSTDQNVEQLLLNLAAASSSSTNNPFMINNDSSFSAGGGGESESAYSMIAREFRLFFYAIIFIICVFGNALVVITLAQNRRMRTVTNIFLINLAASDLLLGVFCMPFTLIGAMLRQWIFGEFMCRAMSYFQCSTVVTSAVTLVCISLERYFAICRPLQSRYVFLDLPAAKRWKIWKMFVTVDYQINMHRRWQTKSHAYMMCIFCWLFGFVCALPIPILSQLIPMVPPDVVFDVTQYSGPYKCREVYPQPQWIYEFLYQLFLSFCVLVIPLILMVGFYTLITFELYRDINVPTSSSASAAQQQKPLCNSNSDSHSQYYSHNNDNKKSTGCAKRNNSPTESEASSPIRAIRCSRSRQSLSPQVPMSPPYQTNGGEFDIIEQNGNIDQQHHRPSSGSGDHGNGTALHSSNGSLRKKYKRTLTSFSLKQQPSLESIVTTTTEHVRGASPLPCQNAVGSTRTTICSTYSTDKLTDGLRSTHTERNLATKKKVIVMLITVVIEFFICFTPITIFNLVAIAAPGQAYLVPSWGISFIQLLMYISTCCNPITYCFLNQKFRQGFKFAFSCNKARRLQLQQSANHQSIKAHAAGGSRTNTNTTRTQSGGAPIGSAGHNGNAGVKNAV